MKVYLLEVNLDFGIDYDDISNKVICVSKNKELLEEACADFLKKLPKIVKKISLDLSKLINKVNFAHNSVLEELTKVPLNSKYGLRLNHFKTCEYSLSRELIYFMKVIYLKNYENSISKELK